MATRSIVARCALGEANCITIEYKAIVLQSLSQLYYNRIQVNCITIEYKAIVLQLVSWRDWEQLYYNWYQIKKAHPIGRSAPGLLDCDYFFALVFDFVFTIDLWGVSIG
jgi:hypothetical protein